MICHDIEMFYAREIMTAFIDGILNTKTFEFDRSVSEIRRTSGTAIRTGLDELIHQGAFELRQSRDLSILMHLSAGL